MNHGSAAPGDNVPRPTPFDLNQPLGRLRVVCNTGFGLQHIRLDQAPAGVLGVTGGTITDVRIHGDIDTPRATFTLVGPTGDAAIISVSTAVYLEVFGDLVNGRYAELHGTIARPFRNGPAHLQLRAITLD